MVVAATTGEGAGAAVVIEHSMIVEEDLDAAENDLSRVRPLDEVRIVAAAVVGIEIDMYPKIAVAVIAVAQLHAPTRLVREARVTIRAPDPARVVTEAVRVADLADPVAQTVAGAHHDDRHRVSTTMASVRGRQDAALTDLATPVAGIALRPRAARILMAVDVLHRQRDADILNP